MLDVNHEYMRVYSFSLGARGVLGRSRLGRWIEFASHLQRNQSFLMERYTSSDRTQALEGRLVGWKADNVEIVLRPSHSLEPCSGS